MTSLTEENKYFLFFRNEHACIIKFDEQTDTYWAYIGFNIRHKYYDSTFIDLGPGLHKLRPPSNITGNEALEKKWWVGFQCSFDQKKSIDALISVIDILGE